MPDPQVHAITQPYWIEPARSEDREAVNALMWASKAHWGYPPQAMAHWREDLTLSPRDMETHAVYLLRAPEGQGVKGLHGAYAYRPTMAGQVELEYLFVAPDAMGRGVGRALLEDFLAGVRQAAYHSIRVLSDPYSEAFYAHFGFRRLAGENGKQPAAAPGLPDDRYLPILEKRMNPIPGAVTGERVELCPMDPSDLRHAYAWMVHSNLSPTWTGPPAYADRAKPSWEAFLERYGAMAEPHPATGRGYRIEHEHQPVGIILHGPLHEGSEDGPWGSNVPVALEAWMADVRLTRRGYGSDAILALCRHLRNAEDRTHFYACPSKRQADALRVLDHLGFRPMDLMPSDMLVYYADPQPMLAQWPLTSF